MKPLIITVVGESGSGKSLMADYIEEKFGIKMIQSYTDRPKRDDKDTGHKFLTKEEYDQLKKEDMIAYTQWGQYRYCCLTNDIKERNFYVIDEHGLDYLEENFNTLYNVVSIRLYRSEEDRRKDVGIGRVGRDEGKFNKSDRDYDYVLFNDSTDNFFEDIDELVFKILERN